MHSHQLQNYGFDFGLARRNFLRVSALAIAGSALLPRRNSWAQQPPASAGPASPQLVEDLVAANRIIADQGVVDGYGHVSVRHDKDPNHYLISRSLAPALSLGDDFGLVLPTDDGWYAPGLPFDNSERAAQDPPVGLFPVAGIWRLYQAERTYVDRPSRGRAVASLMGCVAFPWTMPSCVNAWAG